VTKLNYYAVVVATTPFLFAGVIVGLLERALGRDGAVAEWCARLFLRAVERGKTPAWQRAPSAGGKHA
jgi:hypothetical protein